MMITKQMRMKAICPLLFLLGLLFACRDEDPVPENQEELITTVLLTFTPESAGMPVLFQFIDPDGDGGISPEIFVDTLQSHTTYQGSVRLLNASVIPADEITLEVLEEAEEHQFFFIPAGVELTHTYLDTDTDGNPVGVENTFVTGQAGSGYLTLTLRHLPDKFGPGVRAGDITNAGGETDVEVEFTIVVR